MSVSPVLKARSQVGVAAQFGTPEDLVVAKRALKVANLEQAIQRALEAAPVPTAEQRAQLAALLAGGDAR